MLIETAATGRPLITTTIPGCKETVEDGVNGFLFEPGNRKMMVEVVERFISLPKDQKAQMGKESRRLAEERFSRNIVVSKYSALVRKRARRIGRI